MDNRHTAAQCPAEHVCPFALTMVYIPMQPFGATYDADKALCRGTLFPDLDKPLLAIGGRTHG